jgi:hypothetical protein
MLKGYPKQGCGPFGARTPVSGCSQLFGDLLKFENGFGKGLYMGKLYAHSFVRPAG